MTHYFKINSMKTSRGKFKFMVIGIKAIAPFRLNVNGKIILCSNEVIVLGINIDDELKSKVGL